MAHTEAVMECVAEMRKIPRFQSAPDDQKAKAAEYAFNRLHEDAVENLPVGCSGDDLKHYAKAATKRVHGKLSEMKSGEFEAVNGFPIVLVLSLLPMLWQWWTKLKEWMGW